MTGGRGSMAIGPVTLEGRHVRLEPLTRGHLGGLCEAGLGTDALDWLTTAVGSAGEMASWVDATLEAQAAGTALPFAAVEAGSGRVVGSTRFLAIEPAHRRLEIGSTWLAPPWRRTPINTEAKFLLLRHAFEALGANRVELKADALNARSRAAILRIGAAEEGTLRAHMVMPDGRLRDTVYFGIIAREWPAVRDRLTAMLGRPWV